MPLPLIRPFEENDYTALAELLNAVYPEHSTTERALRDAAAKNDPKCRHGRWVAVAEGRVIGSGGYDQNPSVYHPRKFWINVAIHPDRWGRGVGAALYEHVMSALEAFDPISLTSWAREDMTRKVKFLEDRGFVEAMRSYESILTVSSCDLSPYANLHARLAAEGIAIKTLRELENDPRYREKLHGLHNELDQDVPSTDPVTPVSFEHFARHHFENPNLLPDAFFVAVKGDEYLGVSELWKGEANPDLHTGLTGVKREYRRKGIALAMKVRGIQFAKDYGYHKIHTWNAAHNRAMLSINEALGFVKRPASIDYVKVVKEA